MLQLERLNNYCLMFSSVKQKISHFHQRKSSRAPVSLDSKQKPFTIVFLHELNERKKSMGTKNSKFVEVTPQKIPLKCQNLSPAFDKTDRKTHNFSNEVDNDDVGWLRFVSDIDENEIRCEKSFINSVRNSQGCGFHERRRWGTEQILSEKIWTHQQAMKVQKAKDNKLKQSVERLNRQCIVCGLETYVNSSEKMECIHRVHKECTEHNNFKINYKCRFCEMKVRK